MTRYILFFLFGISISTGLKAQVFTEVDPAVTNFENLGDGVIAWGDYDNDGDLDILLMGSRTTSFNDLFTKIYRNKGDGTFEDSGISLPGTYRGSAAWGDYDNDGYLDIVLTGINNTIGRLTRIYRNKGNGTFESSFISLPDAYDSFVAWADYDNDGYLDLSVTGLDPYNVPVTIIYRNKRNGTFENSGISLAGLRYGSLAWADYDNDGDQDLALAGFADINGNTIISRIYRNKGDGTFEDAGIPLTPVVNGSLAWEDYDNDGDLDLLIAGQPGVCKLYRNKGDGTFEDSGIPLDGLNYSAASWGDYDNDGDRDITLVGYTGGALYGQIYRNKGDGTFENSGIAIPGFSSASMSFGDADNDGDLDLLISGYNSGYKTRLYINNTITPNTKPTAPTGLKVGLASDGKSVTLSWQRATDAQTAQNGLSYNVYISEVLSPMANITNGYRRISATGNAGELTSYTIKGLIPGRKYSWSVQAVDAAFAGSDFAAVQEFTAPAFEENVLSGLPDLYRSKVCSGDYDNDGDLDILLIGQGSTGVISKVFRNKGDGTFEDSGIPLPGLTNSAAAWGDYDNDGHLDFVITGLFSGTGLFGGIYHNKGDGTFEDSGIPIQAVDRGALAWGDYDNDGDLDLVLTGYSAFNNSSYFSRIYRNKGDGTFEDSGIPILSVGSSTVGWGDYDNDGDLDLLLSGTSGPASFKIYRNKGDGTFQDSGLNLGFQFGGAAAWGDYDNDGDLDFVICGNSSLPAVGLFTRIYRNRGNGTFEDIAAPLIGAYAGSASWGDYDNDGDLDLLITGLEDLHSLGLAGSRLYRNKGDGTFENIGMPLTNVGMSGAAWGDYNNDGHLDIVLTGSNPGSATRLYKNIHPSSPNTKPQAPTGLQVTLSTDSKSATLTWQKATDAETAQPGLNYNVYVRKASDTLQAPMANMTNGYRRIAAMGNALINTDTIKGLDLNTTYYWSVQAIDATFEGSPFAAEQSFVTKNTQTISFTNITATYGDADFDPGATTTSSLPITFSSDDASVATIVAGKIHITGTGTANITASQAGNGSFTPATDVTVSITVSKKQLTVTAANKTMIYGDAQPTLTYSIAGLKTGETESVFTTPVSIITNATTNVGVYSITASNAAAANYDFVYQAGSLTISKKQLTVTAENKSITYGNALPTLSYIITGFKPGETESVFTTPVSIITNATTNVGVYSITPSNAAAANYDFAYQAGSLTISKKQLTVTAANKTMTYGDAQPTLTYSITGFITGETESVFTTPVSITTNSTGNVGVFNITANNAVAANYDFTYQPATLTITKKQLTVTAANKTITYGDVQPTLTYSITGFKTGETESVFTTPVSITTNSTGNVGVFNITANNAVAANYDFTYQPATLTITKKQLTVTAGNKTITYGDAQPTLTYTITGFKTGETESVFTTPVSITTNSTGNVGVFNITVNNAVAANYDFTYQPATLTITKKQLTVTAANKTITYGDALPTLTYSITGFKTGETESVFTTPVSITTDATGDAGVFNITVSNAATSNYDFTYQGATLTVQKAAANITFSPLQKTYGDADFAPGASIGNGLPITYTSTGAATIVGGNIHITGAGTATITAKQTGNNNYGAAADVSVTLTVNKKQLTVTAENKTITYGDALPTLTYTITGFVPSETESAFTTPVGITTDATGNAGIFNITATGAAADNYDFTYQGATLTIQKATAQISISPRQATYGDADFNPGATITNGLPITYTSDHSNVATIVNGNIHITGAGTTTITAHQPGNNNYNAAADVAVTLTVNKKQLTVTAADKTKIYGSDLPVFTYNITGFANGETETVFNTPVIITTPATAASNVGTYPITPSNAGANNYLFIYTDGVLSISKAPSTISFVSLPTKTYGDGDFNPGASISNGLPITYTSTGAATIVGGNIHITGAGTATITAKQTGNNNYEAAADVSVTLTVSKKQLIVTTTDQTKRYGEPNPAFTYNITGFVFGENESVFTSPLNITSTGVNAGTYPITPSNAAADNYVLNYVAGTLTIQKAAQTTTFNSLPVKTYGDADFSPGATNSAGLPITYTTSDPNVATIINGNIHITGAGAVTITVTQTGNNNYNAATSVSQQLIINKAMQSIMFGPMAKRTTGEPAFDPGASASSGLPVSYQIQNTSIASLNGNRISPIRSGFTNIIATQPGNKNYEPATAVMQELEIVTGNTIKIQDAVTPNGDGINDYLLIEGIRQFPDNQLYISNAAGKIVFEAKGYNNTNNTFKGFAGNGNTLLTRGVYYYVLFYQGKKQTGFFVLEY